MTKKILYTSMILLIILFSLFTLVGCSGPPAHIEYDSLLELQNAWPEYYYFDFDFEKMPYCGVHSDEHIRQGKDIYDYKYNGYSIEFQEYQIEFNLEMRYVSIFVYSNSECTINELVPSLTSTSDGYTLDIYTIDRIECSLTYSTIYGLNRYTIALYFMIDEITYYIRLDETLEDSNTEQITKECFLSLVSPAIENRHKGIN